MNMMRSQQEVRYRKAWFLHQLPYSPPPQKKKHALLRQGWLELEYFKIAIWRIYLNIPLRDLQACTVIY